MSIMTLIHSLRPASLGKRFELDELGMMRKSVVANVLAGKAVAVCSERPEKLSGAQPRLRGEKHRVYARAVSCGQIKCSGAAGHREQTCQNAEVCFERGPRWGSGSRR